MPNVGHLWLEIKNKRKKLEKIRFVFLGIWILGHDKCKQTVKLKGGCVMAR